jgi:cell division protein FtsI (penicillin-binding protein 3)
VVLFGTAKNLAGLNGYTSAGKTGTAQKIDVLTHRYSKTKYIASFVGIAPVNSPAISVAVVIDSPEGNHYGNINAAPVFREVAQEVLEYLGVPHDTNLAAPKDLAKAQAAPEIDEAPSDHTGDLDALFAEVNNLPADDPLRSKGSGQQPVPSAANELTTGTEQAQAVPPADAMGNIPGRIMAENADAMAGVSPPAPPPPKLPAHTAEAKKETPSLAATVAAREPHGSGHGVVVDAADRIGVPSFLGEPLRVAVESASTAGLALQIVGSGIAREQVPAPGSKVPPGTEIVVRFTR